MSIPLFEHKAKIARISRAYNDLRHLVRDDECTPESLGRIETSLLKLEERNKHNCGALCYSPRLTDYISGLKKDISLIKENNYNKDRMFYDIGSRMGAIRI